MVGRVRQQFARWRQEPEAVRLRIATLLTGGAGIVIAALWLLVLLPLQLVLTKPSSNDGVVQQLQAVIQPTASPQVAGASTLPTSLTTPEPTPTTWPFP